MSPIGDLNEELVSGVLQAGGWSETADDNGGGERLPQSFAATLVGAATAPAGSPSQETLIGAGILVLTLSVAEWGMHWDSAAPADPAGSNWQGPRNITQGKHLMSYALGGIGLPHLDVAGAARFFAAFVERVPAAQQDLRRIGALSGTFHYDAIRARGGTCAADPSKAVLMQDLDGQPFQHAFPVFGGSKYCPRFNPDGQLDARAWQTLRHWSRVALRRRDMQAWIIKTWLNEVWVPAHDEVLGRPHGTIQEALVVARMWNSSKGEALAALQAAGAEAEPAKRIQVELDHYGQQSATNRERAGVMKRPGVVYAAMQTG